MTEPLHAMNDLAALVAAEARKVQSRLVQEAFETALVRGALTMNPNAENYIGRFMYMGDNNAGLHLFKHSLTRQYLAPVRPR